jgi:ATP-binding cassette, subfamily B, bacterial PglK
MYEQFKKINSILNINERRKLIFLAITKFVSGFMDMIGVASIAPFLAVITNKNLLNTNDFILKIKIYINVDNNSFIFLLAIFSLLLIVLNQIVRLFSLWYENYVSHSLWLSFHTKLFQFYINRPYSYHIQTNSNQLLEKLSIQANATVAGLITPFFQILGNVFTFMFLIALLFIADSFVTTILLITIGIFYLLIFTKLKKKISEYGEYGPEFSAKTFKLSDQAFRSIKDIKVKNNSSFYINLFNKLANRYAKNSINFQFLINFPRSAIELFIYFFGYSIVIFLLIYQTQQFNEVAVILGIYALALQKLLPATQNIFHQISQARYYRPSFEKIYNDLKSSLHNTQDKNNAKIDFKINEKKAFNKEILLSKIKFKYPSSNNIAIEIDNLLIEKNKFFGITGSTGSGKSTFIDILIGLLEPTSGEIKIDNIKFKNLTLKNWTSKIGYVPQFAFMADDTIINNIALGLEEKYIDIKRIEQVCKICEISDFVEKNLPHKYNTQIGENGVRLSGGQRQRLSLARAIYKKPDLLILDESTNSLDSNTEKKILNNFLKEKNLTIVMVSHRISTLKQCDNIILFDKGKINSIGNYNYLIESNSLFKSLADEKEINT